MDVDQTRSFEDLGYAGPFDLVDIPDANGLAKALNRAKSRMFFWHRVLSRVPLMKTCFPISRWGAAKSRKGIHAVYGKAYRLGSDRRVVDRLTQVLGPDVLLCSSIVINQRPGASHYWHYDIEARDWNGLTVWVALANVSRKSTLQIITRSHRIPSPPPLGLNDELIVAEARRHEAACRKLVLPAEPGQFYILARHLWHSSRNESSKKRSTMVLHYCRTDAEVRWPVADLRDETKLYIKAAYKIPCCLVSGEDRHRKNLLVAPPL